VGRAAEGDERGRVISIGQGQRSAGVGRHRLERAVAKPLGEGLQLCAPSRAASMSPTASMMST
jgi:hypothetical protein